MFGSIKKFGKDRKGAFAMQFALMAIPLTVCTGLAIDGGRAFLARFELASALDAAALAVGSTYNSGADLEAIAKKFVNTNFRTEHDDPIDVQLVTTDTSVKVTGKVTINTYFMPLVGQPHVTVEAESEVRRGGSNIEVAMSLDITGSMNATRMTGLRDAANILIDEVVNVKQTPYFSKIAVVPWSASIYTDTKHVPNSVVTDLRGSLTGQQSLSAAGWRKTGTTTKTISEAGWRTTTGAKTIAAAASNGTGGIDWRWGTSFTISKITKTTTSPNRVQVTTSSNHGYTDGQFVRITGAGGSYTSLNNTIFMVADKANKTFNLKDVSGTYITPPTGTPTDSTAGASQRCWDSACRVGVTTTSAFTGLAAGDFVNITGTTGFPTSQTPNYINNPDTPSGNPTASGTWVVYGIVSGSNTFTLSNWTGPSFGTTMNSGGGKVSECLVSDCRYRVTTTASHSFSVLDYLYFWGLSESGSGTAVNNVVNTTSTIASPSGSVFYMPGWGKNYMDWSSGGSVAACALVTCNVQMTVANSGLSVGERVEVTSATGLTGLNNPNGSNVAWPITAISGNVITLGDTNPSLTGMSGTYGSSGKSQCTTYGCNKYFFTSSGGTPTLFQASPCLVERYGADAATDADPASSPLGISYTSGGTCTSTNYVTPLTSNTSRLKTAITDLKTGGSTAGQLGIAWAWYMLSPNFANVWDKEEENKPKSYTTSELAKIAILMTDGEFNLATCNGVSSATWGTGTRINCDPAKDPFQQAEAICTAMKAEDITIYTVGLQIDTSLYADEFLTKCATSPAHAFLANDNEELKAAFSKIAINISKLRIAH
ncbi:MAG: pilus assembly protein [Hyphomonadaceae bacterium]